MKQKLFALLTVLSLLLTGCAGRGGKMQAGEDTFSIACTTYPVYLLASAIAAPVPEAEVTLVIDQQVSCLHDYTLTMKDMKAIEEADVLVISGGGLENFLSDVLESRTVIDCSADAQLLCTHSHHHSDEEHHHGHDHGDYDPHLWMSPLYYAQMARTLGASLAQYDPAHAEHYLTSSETQAGELEDFYHALLETPEAQSLAGAEIITFHDGFAYFADAFGLTIAAAIEEEEGAEASALDLKETIEIIEAHHLPAVFTERDGSDKAANTIRRECQISVHSLSMMMSGTPSNTLQPYYDTIAENLTTIWEAYHET